MVPVFATHSPCSSHSDGTWAVCSKNLLGCHMTAHHAKGGGTGHAAGHGWRPVSNRQAARSGQRLGQRRQPLTCPARMIVLKAGLISSLLSCAKRPDGWQAASLYQNKSKASGKQMTVKGLEAGSLLCSNDVPGCLTCSPWHLQD